MACKIAAVIATGYQPDAVQKYITAQQSHLFWVDIFYSVTLGENPPLQYKTPVRASYVQCGLISTALQELDNYPQLNSEYILFLRIRQQP